MNVNETLWKVLTKVSSIAEGWVTITYIMNVPGGCVMKVSTGRLDGSRADAESLVSLPGMQFVAGDPPSLEAV